MIIVELTEKAVDAAEPRDKDYVSGMTSYLVYASLLLASAATSSNTDHDAARAAHRSMTSGPPKVPDEGEVPVGAYRAGRQSCGGTPARSQGAQPSRSSARFTAPIERRPCLGKGVGAP